MITDKLSVSGEWRQISSEEEWRSLDEIIKGGDDGIIKDLHWSNQAFVDSELQMVFGGEPYVGILVQLQNEPVSSVELVLTGVRKIRLDTTHDLILSVEVLSDLIILWLSGEGRSQIMGRELFYRIALKPTLGGNRFDIDI
jgi:hypothetical protein